MCSRHNFFFSSTKCFFVFKNTFLKKIFKNKMPLACHRQLDMSVDRGRILPLGGRAPSADGFRAYEKTVDRPNPYSRFSRKDRIAPSQRNESAITPRHGFMSAVGEIEYEKGKRNLPPTQGQSNSFQNDPEPNTPRKGKFMTGAEEAMIAKRIWMEDHPRKLVKAVAPPERPALDAQGRSPFITANGMIGKTEVSPNKAIKNRGTTQEDLDTRNQSSRRAMSESGVMPARYKSPFREAANNREKSPLIPDSLPLHPEIAKGGLEKKQRFAPSRRHEGSLTGVFTPAPQKAPPPYKLVAPFYTSES
jgi:hypothetical protein